MKRFFLTILAWLPLWCMAQTTYLLSSNGSNGITAKEYTDNYGQIYCITAPRMDVYLPQANRPTPMLLVCPGGAYEYVSADNEGQKVADWCLSHGIAVAVLKYRLPNGNEHIPLTDARAALRMIRENATQWNLASDSIGVMGFSAGGHLAASLLCYPEADCKANMGILIYPVLSMDATITHRKTRRMLLGEEPTDEQIAHWTLANAVTSSCPRTLLIACQDDRAVPIANTLTFYQALTQQHVPAEMLILPQGGHGWGFSRTFPMRDVMENALLQWLRQ